MEAPGLQRTTNPQPHPEDQRPPTRRPPTLPAFAALPGRPPPGRERVLSVHFLPNPSAREMDGETPSLPVTGEIDGGLPSLAIAATRLRGPSGPPTSRSGSRPLGPHVPSALSQKASHPSQIGLRSPGRLYVTPTLSKKSPYLFAASALLQGVLLPKQVFAPNPKQFSLSRLLGASIRWALAIRS